MIDNEFHAAVETLRVAEMGTESVAPLLYWLLRMLRPQRVVEVGMGYTTPFIAKALRDNDETVAREKAVLDGHGELPLARTRFYDEPYEPRLVCIDRMTTATSSAPRAWDLLVRLGLSTRCEVIEADLRKAAGHVRNALGRIDFAWVDTWDTVAFIDEYWPLVNPAGGVVAIHYLMTYPEGRAVLDYVESLRHLERGSLEITNLLEPHKREQNSVTLVRRTRDYRDPIDLRANRS